MNPHDAAKDGESSRAVLTVREDGAGLPTSCQLLAFFTFRRHRRLLDEPSPNTVVQVVPARLRCLPQTGGGPHLQWIHASERFITTLELFAERDA